MGGDISTEFRGRPRNLKEYLKLVLEDQMYRDALRDTLEKNG